ncbi:hypothetical protein [Limnofasciculus baicalensis]|uniref:Uncharacterized protein n=1 Tax=Limnofasciculus baicalensis BBK-W-15 TaxID=2699891 RepID=A0AAE3GMD7_9CYAN|nr:hypothetical protein [Limnofasciculus baicalensis]MCP2727271.1 hypothetical protein [Limnofasciculus baicalensis BBK-W-15]
MSGNTDNLSGKQEKCKRESLKTLDFIPQRWLVYQENRQAARQTVKELTADLKLALEKMIF